MNCKKDTERPQPYCYATGPAIYPTARKTGAELEIGDCILTIGGNSIPITGFKPHPGFMSVIDQQFCAARIVCAGDYEVTTFNDTPFRQTNLGTWVQTHLWIWANKRGR